MLIAAILFKGLYAARWIRVIPPIYLKLALTASFVAGENREKKRGAKMIINMNGPQTTILNPNDPGMSSISAPKDR
jgi:hypothetical protein